LRKLSACSVPESPSPQSYSCLCLACSTSPTGWPTDSEVRHARRCWPTGRRLPQRTALSAHSETPSSGRARRVGSGHRAALKIGLMRKPSPRDRRSIDKLRLRVRFGPAAQRAPTCATGGSLWTSGAEFHAHRFRNPDRHPQPGWPNHRAERNVRRICSADTGDHPIRMRQIKARIKTQGHHGSACFGGANAGDHSENTGPLQRRTLYTTRCLTRPNKASELSTEPSEV